MWDWVIKRWGLEQRPPGPLSSWDDSRASGPETGEESPGGWGESASENKLNVLFSAHSLR